MQQCRYVLVFQRNIIYHQCCLCLSAFEFACCNLIYLFFPFPVEQNHLYVLDCINCKLLNPTQWLPQKCSYKNCNCNSNCQELSLVRSQNSCIAYWRKSGPRSAPASSSPASAARSPPSSSSLSILVTCRSSDWGGVYVISSSTAVDFSLVLIEAKLCYLQHNRIGNLSSCEL